MAVWTTLKHKYKHILVTSPVRCQLETILLFCRELPAVQRDDDKAVVCKELLEKNCQNRGKSFVYFEQFPANNSYVPYLEIPEKTNSELFRNTVRANLPTSHKMSKILLDSFNNACTPVSKKKDRKLHFRNCSALKKSKVAVQGG